MIASFLGIYRVLYHGVGTPFFGKFYHQVTSLVLNWGWWCIFSGNPKIQGTLHTVTTLDPDPPGETLTS